LFLVGFAGAFRRSELVAIDREHLRFEATGVTIHVPRGKRDQEGKEADVTLRRMRDASTGVVSDTCPGGRTRGTMIRGPCAAIVAEPGSRATIWPVCWTCDAGARQPVAARG